MTRESPFKYSDHFVENLSSARKIVPLVLDIIGTPRSVVDLGGGTGSWCTVFRENGVQRVLCVDDERIRKEDLLVQPAEFLGCNLAERIPDPVLSDLAVSMEVVEHLRKDMSEHAVDFLTRSADLVLFSAAIPGQPDARHINEHPPLFWKRLFEQRGFQRLDIIRPRIVHDVTISYWYRQNLFLFASAKGLARVKTPRVPYESIPDDFELVHARILDIYRAPKPAPSLRRLLRNLMPGRSLAALRRSKAGS